MGAEMTDVFIIGAGPVGLTLAAELRRHGVNCRIADSGPGPKEHSRAVLIQVRTLEVLDAMGVINDFLSVALPMNSVEMFAYGHPIGSMRMGGLESPHGCPFTLGQNVTEKLLVANLERFGGDVEWNTEVVGLNPDRTEITLKKADGTVETVTASYVVGCDGAAGFLRRAVDFGGDVDGHPGHPFIQADVRLRWPLPRNWSAFFLGRNEFILGLALPDGYVRLMATGADGEDVFETGGTAERLAERLTAMAGEPVTITEVHRVSRYSVTSRCALHFRNERFFIAGDAAHLHVPLGGQGMNTGIQDAFNLAWKLAAVINHISPEALLDTYSLERQPVAVTLTEGAEKLFADLTDQNLMFEAAMRLIGPFALQIDSVRRKVGTVISELGISYPENLIVEDLGGNGGPKAGDRAPSALVVRPGQSYETVELHKLFRGSHWTLLAFTGTELDHTHARKIVKDLHDVERAFEAQVRCHLVTAVNPPRDVIWEGSVLSDRTHRLHEAYHVTEPMLFLIRPDGHIGFRGRPSDEPMLGAFLRRVFL
jgi:2-polyprenyl-6-methoxyphenol hydroxylase-like FAD-dependent oxidoreductase